MGQGKQNILQVEENKVKADVHEDLSQHAIDAHAPNSRGISI
ncbi:MAG: hypothetical protein WAM14_26480 [Candidatus Nitrosopolaris sp.]